MPAKSEKQRRFMGAELSRKREGKETVTNMSESELEDFASKEFVMKDTLEFIDNYIKKDDTYISGLGEVPVNETKPIRRVRRIHQTEPSDEVIRQRIKEGGRDAHGMGSRLTGKELRHRKRKNPTNQEMTREDLPREYQYQRFNSRHPYATVEEGPTWSPYTEEDTVDTSQQERRESMDATPTPQQQSQQRVAANRATSQQRVTANAATSQERVKANAAASQQRLTGTTTPDSNLVDESKTVSGKLNSEGMWVPLTPKDTKPHAPGIGDTHETQTPGQIERNKKERERASKQRREFLMRKSVEAIDKYISKEDKVLSSKDLLPQQDNEGNFIPNESLPYTPDVTDVLSLAADAIQTIIKDDVRGNQTTRYGRRDAKQQTKRRGHQRMKTRQGSRDQWNQQMRTAQDKKQKEQ